MRPDEARGWALVNLVFAPFVILGCLGRLFLLFLILGLCIKFIGG